MKFGIQLIKYLSEQKDDTFGALKALVNMGYRLAEPCISMEPFPGFAHAIWPLSWYWDNAREIAELGLEVRSCHVFAQDLNAAVPALRRLATDCGMRQFIVKSPRELTDEALQQAALSYMAAADALAEVGAELLIHNEDRDIAARIAGKTAYEHLLDLCLGKVGAQVDAGWVLAGGEDPEALLWRNAGRVKSLHYKDFARVGDKASETAIGDGLLDVTACFQFARAMGIPQLVDMDNYPGGRDADLAASLARLSRLGQARPNTVSYLNTLDTETGEVRTLKKFDGVIEAPNWLKKTERILYNAGGRIYFYDLASGEVTLLDTGACDHCNNDHVVSPDETELAVSHMAIEEGFSSRVYVVPMAGGAARLVTPNSPSFLHGWSPDGQEFAYCAFRPHEGRREVDVYTIPAAGGEEVRLTDGGFNDGPEYSPDGQYIWFNSTRTGLMQVWRMKRDGSEPTQMTFSERNNWFGHVSPDGRKVVWLSYRKGDLEPHEHLPNMQVELWLMNADGTAPRKIASLFGGQGSINVNSWAGDSRHIAFVSYELEHK